MGAEINREEFSADEHLRFGERLKQSLFALRELLTRPGFGEGELTLGAELELHLIDAAAQPLPVNARVLERAADPQLTLEINRFNLEINSSPCPLAGRPFSELGQELRGFLGKVRDAAQYSGARVALVGILPTLRAAQLGPLALSDSLRYRVLSRALKQMRGAPFEVRIDGRESLRTHCDDVTLEGANTSFQVHLRVPAAAFAAHYNAAQLAAGPVLAATGNSPFFDTRCLWEETRIALFKQAVDTRLERDRDFRPAPRVSFGHGYIRDACEPFMQTVALHVPLLPLLSSEDPLAIVRAGGVPQLSELRLHHGTVWTWNRAVFDPAGDGHVRIEHRVLPAGPTVCDMLANAALTIGLTLALARGVEEKLAACPFEYAQRNFYRAAKHGLDAQLLWPSERPPSPRIVDARTLVLELLPQAEEALTRHGVSAAEASELLDIIRARVTSRRTGAAVQRKLFDASARELPRDAALAAMLETYLRASESDVPVHRWQVWDALAEQRPALR